MSAKHGAKESAAWTRDLDVILLDGIEDNRQGKNLAHERVKALHPLPQGKRRYPKDFEKWMTKVFEKPEDGEAPWLSLEFWQHEVDKVLIQGIFARNVTQDEVVQRIRSVWPKLSISWLGAHTEEVARSGLPRWMDQTFWTSQVDPILTSGLRNANQCQSEAVEKVVQAFPQIHVGMIRDRVRRLRKQRPRERQAVVSVFPLPNGCNGRVTAVGGQADSTTVGAAGPLAPSSTMDQRFWRCEIDPILLVGIQSANQLERETVDKVLRRFSELRIGTIWARLRRLQEQQRENVHAGPPFRWTDELDERLVRIHEEADLSAAVSGVQSITAWPRKAILRRAHKLGIPSRSSGSRRPWTMVEYRFVIESLNHMRVREIAEEIGRSEKAVWDMVGQRGIPARFQDGYTMRELAEKLHVRRLSVQKWVEAGLLHRKRNGRIDEGSLQSFFYSHPETLKWPMFDQDTAFWVSELVEAERARLNGAEAQTRAMLQNSEEMQATEASTPDGIASSTLEADPCEDPVSHNSRVRGASPQ